MTEQTWCLIGLAGLAAGMVLNLALGRRRTEHEEAHSLVHGLVPMIAASAYFAMAFGQGGVTLADGRHFWWARYADWSITTPLLLLGLSLAATHSEFRRPGLVMGLLIADVFMIVAALFFGLTTTF